MLAKRFSLNSLTRAVAKPVSNLFLTQGFKTTSEIYDVHFRASNRPHPLFPNGIVQDRLGDHTGRQQNHIWSEKEVEERMATLYRHTPVTISDRIVNSMASLLEM